MRYVIVGPGAIGGTIGGRLAEHGHDVALVARGAHARALAERGLELKTPDGTVTHAMPAFDDPAKAGIGPGDVVVLAMKTQDTLAALDGLAMCAAHETTVVCAQNGVENERLALRRFANVYAMCVMLPATHLEPGVVVAHSTPISGILDVGRYPSGVDATAEAIAADLASSGFSSEADPRVMRQKYKKLLMNLGNGLEAACGAGTRASDVYARLRDEALACYVAAGIDAASDEEDRARRGDLMRIRPVNGERREGGSSWQSLARGAGSIEVDYLNGEIVLLGRIHGIATPANEVVQEVAGRLARERRPPGSVSLEELTALIDERAGRATASR